MTTIESLHSGSLYNCSDENILSEQIKCLDMLYDYNNTRPSELEKRLELLNKMFAEFGEGSYIEPPLRANWGGHFVHLGKNVYANSNLTLVDDTHIYIGDCTMIGPNVTIDTAGHPILPELREKVQYQYNIPVHIGKNCWIGANVVAYGSPCRVVREIGEHDRIYYFKDRKIDWSGIKSGQK